MLQQQIVMFTGRWRFAICNGYVAQAMCWCCLHQADQPGVAAMREGQGGEQLDVWLRVGGIWLRSAPLPSAVNKSGINLRRTAVVEPFFPLHSLTPDNDQQ